MTEPRYYIYDRKASHDRKPRYWVIDRETSFPVDEATTKRTTLTIARENRSPVIADAPRAETEIRADLANCDRDGVPWPTAAARLLGDIGPLLTDRAAKDAEIASLRGYPQIIEQVHQALDAATIAAHPVRPVVERVQQLAAERDEARAALVQRDAEIANVLQACDDFAALPDSNWTGQMVAATFRAKAT